MTDPEELIPAATVVLVRDSGRLEVLMLRRSSRIAFGGAWVFPGGRIDPDDEGTDIFDRARTAAVREAAEETGLMIDRSGLTPWTYWEPPPAREMVTAGKRRRFSTWFFVAAAPRGGIEVDMGEIHEHRWLSPAEALALHRTGEIELVPPTWVTLHQLDQVDRLADLDDPTRPQVEIERFVTRPVPGTPVRLLWEGDVAYHDPNRIDADGPRHRLTLHPGNWVYDRRG